jgi:hypothetical protein
MNTTYTLRFILSVAAAVLVGAGCSGQGELVVDPHSSDRTQVSMIAIENGGNGEILHFDEATGVTVSNAYEAANGAPLGLPVDNITEAYDQLFLHHRAAGKLTVLDLKTRKRLGEITGFPASADSGICGLAFSNSTWAWVVCYKSDTVYLVDAKNFVIARRIPIPDHSHPTSVGTSGQKIFVGLQLADGRGGVAVLSSNTGLYDVERIIPFPSPIIFAGENPNKTQMLLLSAGTETEGPKLHIINVADFTTFYDIPFTTPSMTSYIGKEPTFAAVSQDYFFYLATPASVLRADTQGGGEVAEWLFGDYRVIGVDQWTDLLYAYAAGGSTLHRVTNEGKELDELPVPAPVKSITFVTEYKTK